MPLDLDYEDGDVRARLQWIVAQLIDLRPFWPKVVSLAIEWWGKQFDTNGGFGGRPWPALSPGYAAWKAVNYPGRGILVLDRDLRAAVSLPDRVMSPSTLELTIPWARLKGENVDVSWHQLGTARMPARPIVFGDPLPAQAALDLDRVMDEYLDDLVARSGL
ncbi:MAG: hypothetical protein H0U46_08020 [Actinobacteria bacterium]|nr:hypothetical protein [Actinomycetota bacterium]